MNDEKKTYNVEDVREAYVAGGLYCSSNASPHTLACLRSAAKERYPSPKKLREEGADNHSVVRFRMNRSVLEVSIDRGYEWEPVVSMEPTPARIKLWADLLEHPYEDDDR